MAKDYWFFLSYSRNDAQDGDPWLKLFYQQLARDVKAVAQLPTNTKIEDIGFIDDQGIEGGTQWTAELAEALQSSRVLVCLYSRSYFNSQWCGKEFQVFLRRVRALASQQGGAWPPLILPVLWDRPAKLPQPFPKVIEDLKLQYQHADFGQTYAEEGLAYLMRREEKQPYQTFCLEFRERVVRAAKSYPLPRLAQLDPWEAVESAFHSPSPPLPTPQGTLPDTVPLPQSYGPDVAWLVYVAGRDEDYLGVRGQCTCYGAGGALWKPYLPPSDRGAGKITQRVVDSSGYLRETLPLSKRLLADLRSAEEKNTLVLLIVDPWSLQLEQFRSPLADLDRANLVNCGVIIVWNDQDFETQQKRDELRRGIETTFLNTLVTEQIYFRDGVNSEADLEKELSAAIESVNRKIMKRFKLLRPVDLSGGALPKIPVPTGVPK
jgi:FxsC-like protein